MPRRPNTRPTSIYWLSDARTGIPFYCGKTVFTPEKRLKGHYRTASEKPQRPLSIRIAEAGAHIRVETVETVPVGQDWAARERWWIYTLRTFYTGCVNATDGGEGLPGVIFSAETRAKIGDVHRGSKRSPEARAKMSAARKLRVITDETRARLSAAGKIRSAESRAKSAASSRGRVPSAETRAKLSAALKGRLKSAETRAKIGEANRGKVRSPEDRAKMRATATGKKHTAETRAKMSVVQKARGLEIGLSLRGRKHTEETRAKMKDAWKLRPARRLQIGATNAHA